MACVNHANSTGMQPYNQGRQTGGVGGDSTPPEFWMGGLNTCQPPLILRKKILRVVWLPLNSSNYIVYVFLST